MEEVEGMKKCTRCRKHPGVHDWTLEPCSVPDRDNIKASFCHECDIELNDIMLSFFRVKGKTKLMEAYRYWLGSA
jgi:hypothetical protein